jgi:YacP-like NYN domain
VAPSAPPAIEHRRLRSAIEFAVAMAEAGQRLRPPLTFPAGLRPFFRQSRIPGSSLGSLRRAIEADDRFRRRIAVGALPELVDPIGIEWLRREDGWQERIGELIDEADRHAQRADAESTLRRAERRREAAEQAATRTRVEFVALRSRIEELLQQVDEQRAARDEAVTVARQTAELLAAAKTAERHANDRAEAARSRLAAVEAERDAALRLAEEASSQRDTLLADRAERAGVGLAAAQVAELRTVAQSARAVADRLSDLVDVGGSSRRPLALPGGVARDSLRATEHLLRASGALVVIDGYNVAKLGWPEGTLVDQRELALDVIDDAARRFGSDVTVVFDGADVVGAHAVRRRLARVVYSPAGILADDVIRSIVASTPPERPVVVVTNDQAVRRSVAAAGANLMSSDAFLALARR